MATPRNNGIIEPMQIKIVSNLGVGSTPPSVVGGHSAVASGNQQVQRENLDKCSVNSSYNDGNNSRVKNLDPVTIF